MHDFVILYIDNQENIVTLSCKDLLNVDIFYYLKRKTHLLKSPLISFEQPLSIGKLSSALTDTMLNSNFT